MLLWNELKRKQMMGYDFHRQKPIAKYIADFYCPALRLVIEIDGDSQVGQDARDKRRQKDLEAVGLMFLRFEDLSVKRNMEGVLKSIRRWIQEREKLL